MRGEVDESFETTGLHISQSYNIELPNEYVSVCVCVCNFTLALMLFCISNTLLQCIHAL